MVLIVKVVAVYKVDIYFRTVGVGKVCGLIPLTALYIILQYPRFLVRTVYIITTTTTPTVRKYIIIFVIKSKSGVRVVVVNSSGKVINTFCRQSNFIPESAAVIGHHYFGFVYRKLIRVSGNDRETADKDGGLKFTYGDQKMTDTIIRNYYLQEFSDNQLTPLTENLKNAIIEFTKAYAEEHKNDGDKAKYGYYEDQSYPRRSVFPSRVKPG